MKKMTMICMVALLVMAMSCKKEKVENTAVGAGFRATLEGQVGDSKTYLDGVKVKWDNDDAVKVVNANGTAKVFTIGENYGDYADLVSADATEAFYKPTYKAYYPVDLLDEGTGKVSLKGTQTYSEVEVGEGATAGSFGKGFNPMAACSNGKVLNFKNICGMLALNLKGTCTVESITITSKDPNEKLCGKGDIALTNSGVELGPLTDGGNSITLNCNNVQLDNATAKTFYFVLPAGTLASGFNVLLKSGDKVWSGSASQNTAIHQNKIRKMPEQNVVTHDPITPSEVTVTAGCVNCTYTLRGSFTVPEGTYTCEYGFVYSETNHMPTLADSKILVNNESLSGGTKNFTADLPALTLGETYYFRAYAIIDGVVYSDEVKTVIRDEPKPLPIGWTNGRNPHPFTVGSDKVVYFSQGNLQYIGSASHAYWKFAEHQFDVLGTTTGQNSADADKDRDFFGWGTSGFEYANHRSMYQPYSTGTTDSEYGPASGNLSVSAKSDWGANAISNGSGNSWRTLTGSSYGEWYYLLGHRTNAANLYGVGMVDCTGGLIILPDDWNWSGDVASFKDDWTAGDSEWTNVYTYSEWAKMEAAGAVFLPAAGYRDGTLVYGVGYNGNYWSSSFKDSSIAYGLGFNGVVYGHAYNNFYYGFAVRLVSDN